jgi:hypothetical protein
MVRHWVDIRASTWGVNAVHGMLDIILFKPGKIKLRTIEVSAL